MIRTLDRYLGLAASGNYLSYCLIVDDVLRKAGAISIRCHAKDHSSRIQEAFKLIRSDIEYKRDTPDDSPVCFVGLRSYHMTPRSHIDARRQYNQCRIRTIVECQADSIFRTKPYIFGERELFQTIARITNEKITSTTSLVDCCRKRLTSLLSVDPIKFNGIAVAWATVVCLKRKLEIESMKLDPNFMGRVESKIKTDKIVTELVASIEKERDEKIGMTTKYSTITLQHLNYN
ncbi:hypothetical protein BgAZ_105300 [Babesia gibsoni]|uniref:Uncharacterized protein n=1 Tax=Babesia gibsoni TaxID=33632 RepID=A0AAD8PFW3_BABGI|nr:hypothetical protein BgAZ_105300 [Babesia gibsoni]